MGITVNTIEQLVRAKNNGVNFSKAATIGHQAFWHCTAEGYQQVLQSYGLQNTKHDRMDLSFLENGKYTDSLFYDLDAIELIVYDANAYEGASQIHDFNTLIDKKHHQKYSVVYDGGSLEHIFNAPVALSNFMNMVAVGGHYISAVPCNNWAGHGFYQFNPEFFYRALSEENGFKNTQVFTYNETGASNAQHFVDPKSLGHRVEFASQTQLSLFVISERFAVKNIFENYPQQSDYQFSNWTK